MKYLKHNWLIHKVVDKQIEKAIRSYASGMMLDIGCGDKPYEEIAKFHVKKYIGMDHPETLHDKKNVDIFCLAEYLPLKENIADSVLLTSVLEHIEEPDKTIHEISRVLKGGGVLILTTPFMWHIHEAPRDFFRYTKYGLRYLLAKNGFEIIGIKATNGFWINFGQEFNYYLLKFRKNLILRILITTFSLIVQVSAYFLDKVQRDEDFTSNYIVVARKKV